VGLIHGRPRKVAIEPWFLDHLEASFVEAKEEDSARLSVRTVRLLITEIRRLRALPQKIQDEFSSILDRTRRHKLRMLKRGLCVDCGKPAQGRYCLVCRSKRNVPKAQRAERRQKEQP
jgi:hypothetical protein